MNSVAFMVLFALLFSVVIFRKKIKSYALEGRVKLRDSVVSAENVGASFPVITDFTDIEDCLKSSEDCDVTYKTKSSHTTASSIKKVEYAMASNDEKNLPKYNPTVLQDIYPTDPA